MTDANPLEQLRSIEPTHLVGPHNAQYAVASGALDIRDTIVIKDRDLFLLTDFDGNVPRENINALGLYFQDTRFLSAYELVLEGIPPTFLLSTGKQGFAEVQELTNPDLRLPTGATIPKETITFHRERVITPMTLHEALTITNFNVAEVPLELVIYFDSDFKDIFELRGFVVDYPRGTLHPPRWRDRALTFQYDGADQIIRKTVLEFDPAPTSRRGGQVAYGLQLGARSSMTLRLRVSVELSSVSKPTEPPATNLTALVERGNEGYARWIKNQPKLTSDSRIWNDLIDRSRMDLYLLQSGHTRDLYPAAGIPWFATLFGRDSLITALENIWEVSQARSILKRMADLQGVKVDPWRDEEPGKIMHELRRGELAHCNVVPFNPYYGTVDATPLFVILLSEYFRLTGDVELPRLLEPNLRAALDWMETYGDTDRDGFLDYEQASGSGLVNQGWKDSWDAVMHKNGNLADPPIALVEVQGYAYRARLGASDLYRALGNDAEATRQHFLASWLRDAFNDTFWMEDEGFYCLALDGQHRQCKVISSNPGQALWTGIVPPERAARVADRLMRPDMFTGWGIRTLSTSEERYNPMGYHVGTIWPHDNALIAMGFKQYGEDRKLRQLVTGFFESARQFTDLRMPELFCGYDRVQYPVPVRYPVACSPQAWAAGAALLFMRAMLGIFPVASRNELLVIRPDLPEWLNSITVEGLRVGPNSVDLRYQRQGQHTFTEVIRQSPDLRVVFLEHWPLE